MSSVSEEKIILTPNDVVVFNTSLRKHPGNTRYQELIQESVEEYIEKTKQKKGFEVVNHITERIQSLGGRFLQKDKEGDFVEMPLLRAQSLTAKWIRQKANKHKFKQGGTEVDNGQFEDTYDQAIAMRASLEKAFQEIIDAFNAQNSETTSSFKPEPNDVLGRLSRKDASLHPGNQLFMKAVKERMFEYEKYTQFDTGKMTVPYRVIQKVLDRQGRFLHIKNSRWHATPFEKAVTKTCQAFREALADHYGPKTEIEAVALQSTKTDSDKEVFSMDDFKPNDVLMGAGRVQRNFPGTLQYLQWMRDFKDEYESTPKGGKSDIVYRVIGLVHEAGGRFLERDFKDHDKWYKVDPKRIFARTAQALRDLLLKGDDEGVDDKAKTSALRNDRVGYKLINKPPPAGRYSSLIQQAQRARAKNSNDEDDDDGSTEDEETEDESDNASTPGEGERLENAVNKMPQSSLGALADMSANLSENGETEDENDDVDNTVNEDPPKSTFSTPHRELLSESSSDEEETGIETITPNDVLMGAGKQVRGYVGTKQYLEWIRELKEEYDDAPIGRKSDVVNRVISFVRNSGGRFLQKDGVLWAKVPRKKVFARVSQAFRDIKTDTGSPSNAKSTKLGTGQPLKLLAGIKMFKKRAPAGRYASLIQQAQKSNGSQASTENDDGQTNGDETDDSNGSENEPDVEDVVSDTETEDSFPMKRRKISY